MSNHGDILRVLKRIEDLLVRIADNIAPAEAEPAPAGSGKKPAKPPKGWFRRIRPRTAPAGSGNQPARLFAAGITGLVVLFPLVRLHQWSYTAGKEIIGDVAAFSLMLTSAIWLAIFLQLSGLGKRDLRAARGETSWAVPVLSEVVFGVGYAIVIISQFGKLVREDLASAPDQAVGGIVLVLASAFLQASLIWLAAAVSPMYMQWACKKAFAWHGLCGVLKMSDSWSDEENRNRQAWALTVPAVVLLVYLHLPFAEVHGYGRNEKLLLLGVILVWALIVYGSMKGLRLSIPIFLDSVLITLLVMVLVSSNFLAWNRWFIAGMVLVVASFAYRIIYVRRLLRSGRQAPGTEADDDETRSQTDA